MNDNQRYILWSEKYNALSNEIRILKSLQFCTSKNELSASVNSDSK